MTSAILMEEEGLTIGQDCRRIVLKNCRHGGGGVKNQGKLPTLFMDGPLLHHQQQFALFVKSRQRRVKKPAAARGTI